MSRPTQPTGTKTLEELRMYSIIAKPFYDAGLDPKDHITENYSQSGIVNQELINVAAEVRQTLFGVGFNGGKGCCYTLSGTGSSTTTRDVVLKCKSGRMVSGYIVVKDGQHVFECIDGRIIEGTKMSDGKVHIDL